MKTKNMIFPDRIKQGDKVAIISLSSGILGEQQVRHEIEIGLKRLKEMGLIPIFMPNSMKGIEYLKEHPEARAADLKMAFLDKDIKMIITAIGGDDTYTTIPFLMNDKEFVTAVRKNPKIFTGFSDTTVNHLMFNKIGLSTFYGPAFLVDICELDKDMLPYTKEYFLSFFDEYQNFEILSSPIWYLDRTDYSKNAINVSRISYEEIHHFELLNGSGIKSGKLFGGCIETIYDLLTGERYGEENKINEKYNLIPTLTELKEKILFLETSEEKTSPQKLEKMLNEFKKRKILSIVQGVIIGKPYNEIFYEEYKNVYKNIFSDLSTPVLYNVNFGHSYPRCILPYDALATIDFDNKTIKIKQKQKNYYDKI